jgi:predicted GNAT family acetyltransferase
MGGSVRKHPAVELPAGPIVATVQRAIVGGVLDQPEYKQRPSQPGQAEVRARHAGRAGRGRLSPLRRRHDHLSHRVPPPVRGRLYGYLLVRGALDEVRRLELRVVPECWFVREVIDRNRELQDLL